MATHCCYRNLSGFQKSVPLAVKNVKIILLSNETEEQRNEREAEA